ncbi:MAG: TIGR02757 family protein [Flavobacteriaceae bacterium]
MNKQDLKEFLEAKVHQYNHPGFLADDPISVPHNFEQKEDIEISAFLTATIAWGNRKSIIRSAKRMMDIMDWEPYNFVKNYKPSDSVKFAGYVHRTFNEEDLKYFVISLQNVYTNHGGLEAIFSLHKNDNNLQAAISVFKKRFFELNHPKRSTKHISDPLKGSAAKRINMFLRWMVRDNSQGVDFGLWMEIKPSQLSCPLDVHSGRVARKLGLLHRQQNDAKAVMELDASLRKLDPADPVKYDFALFGLGVFEKF